MKLLKVPTKQNKREGILKIHGLSITTKGRLKVLQEKVIFCLVLIAREPIMLRKIVIIKINLFFAVIFAINSATVKSIAESRKNNVSSNQINK